MYMTVCTTCVQAGWVTRCQPTPRCTPSQRCTASNTWSHRHGTYEYHIADIKGSLHEILELRFYWDHFEFSRKFSEIFAIYFLSPVSCITCPVHRWNDTGEKLLPVTTTPRRLPLVLGFHWSPVSAPPVIFFRRFRWQRRWNCCNNICLPSAYTSKITLL